MDEDDEDEREPKSISEETTKEMEATGRAKAGPSKGNGKGKGGISIPTSGIGTMRTGFSRSQADEMEVCAIKQSIGITNYKSHHISARKENAFSLICFTRLFSDNWAQ